MVSSVASMTLVLALAATGGAHSQNHGRGWILPPGPGLGYGFPNGQPDGYGYFDHGVYLPIGADRVSEYYFPRYLALPANQLFMPTYYNPFVSRGQRYLPYAGCGGHHPAGPPARANSQLPVHPYDESTGRGPEIAVPSYNGISEAPPINPGSTGLTP